MAWNETSRPAVAATSLNSQPPWTRLFFSGGRRSLTLAVWSLVSLILLIHCLSRITDTSKPKLIKIHSDHLSITHEFEQIEEEADFHLPPPQKRKPRVLKQKGHKKKYNPFVSEFLDESSQIHSLLFPDMRLAMGPTKDEENVNSSRKLKYFYPGRVWLDTDGNPIQAHGGGILFDQKTGTYYWYGENKNGPTYHVQPKGTARVDIIGVSCYSSKDLWTWKYEGLAIESQNVNLTHDLYKSNILERPKVIFNEKTSKYVMWMQIDDATYTKASVGVAISESPVGPFEYLYSWRPHGSDSRDMTLFKDDDGIAYIVYSSSNNSDLHVGPLTEDYLGLTYVFRKILVGKRREAPAVFKHEKTYYMITSGCSGWAPNEAMVHAAQSMLGPWETMRNNPCLGGNKVMRNTTYFSQATFVLPLNGLPDLFIFMADRWKPADLKDSRYVWLPLKIGGIADGSMDSTFGFPSWFRVSVFWHRRWKLPEGYRYNRR